MNVDKVTHILQPCKSCEKCFNNSKKSFHLIGPIIEQSYFTNFNDLAIKLTKVSTIFFLILGVFLSRFKGFL